MVVSTYLKKDFSHFIFYPTSFRRQRRSQLRLLPDSRLRDLASRKSTLLAQVAQRRCRPRHCCRHSQIHYSAGHSPAQLS